MPLFVYKAKKENAESVTGEISARDTDEAVELISQQGLLPVKVEEKTEAGLGFVRRTKSIRRHEVYLFTRQLVNLIKSGVPLIQALDSLARQMRGTALGVVVADIAAEIRNGRSFSAGLADRPLVFSSLYVALAKAGEESGKLRDLLARMAAYYKQQEDISSKVRMALAYPAFMLFAGVGTVLFVLTFVMPKITLLFNGLGNALPLPTVIVMNFSQALRQGWPFIIIFLAAFLLFWRTGGRAPAVKQMFNKSVLAVPGIKALVIKVELERFTRTLSLLLASGIPILRAFEIAIPTLSNAALQKDLWLCHSKVEGGISFADSLREVIWMPDIVSQLVAVGEESGELPQALNDVADTYEQEIAETLKTVTTLLEPLLILIVGGVVGFIVFAMLLPVFQMDLFSR